MSDEKNKKNLSIELLRAFMIFEAILVHLWVKQDRIPVEHLLFDYYLDKAVLVLVIISFYFLEPKLLIPKWSLWKRIRRILIPYCFWGIAYWIYMVGSYIIKKEIGITYGVDLLIKQLVNGGELYPPYWYLLVLMILTVFYYLLFKLAGNKRAVYVTVVLMILCIYLQYSGLNVEFWQKYSMPNQYTFGRIVEVFPASVVGILLSHYKLTDKLRGSLVVIGCISYILLDLVFRFFRSVEGYSYAGAGALVSAIVVFILACNISTDHIGEKGRIVIQNITKYTFGIYSIHAFTALLLYRITGWDGYSVSFGFYFLVYIVAYLISFVIGHIPIQIFKGLVE